MCGFVILTASVVEYPLQKFPFPGYVNTPNTSAPQVNPESIKVVFAAIDSLEPFAICSDSSYVELRE